MAAATSLSGSGCLGDLHGEAAHSSGGADDQHLVTRLDAPPVAYSLECGEGGDRHGGGLFERDVAAHDLARLAQLWPNLRAAVAWACTSRDVELAVALVRRRDLQGDPDSDRPHGVQLGDRSRAYRTLRDNLDVLLDTDHTDVTRMVAVEFITMVGAIDRFADAARVLTYLDTTGDYGTLARENLVADVVRRIDADPHLGPSREPQPRCTRCAGVHA